MAAGTIGWFNPRCNTELYVTSKKAAKDHCTAVAEYHEEMDVDISGLKTCQELVRQAVMSGWVRVNYYRGDLFLQAMTEKDARSTARYYAEELPYEYINIDLPKTSFTVPPGEIRKWLKGKPVAKGNPMQSRYTPEQTAMHMVQIRNGDVVDAIEWAQLHEGANIMEGDREAAAYWSDVGKALRAMATRGRASNPVYDVPEKVRREAANGLAMREWRSQSTKRPGGTEIGVARAAQLVRGTIDEHGIRRMKAFFDRFKHLKGHPGWGSPMMPGFVAWSLWGGDPGYAWVKKVLRER